MNYRNEWLFGCFGTSNAESIHVEFTNGREADYTMSIYNSLKTDPTVKTIISNETGEIYLDR